MSVSDLRPLGRGQTHVLPGAHIAMEEFFRWQQGAHGEVGSLGPGWNMEADPEHGEPSSLDVIPSHTSVATPTAVDMLCLCRARNGTTRRPIPRKRWPQGHPDHGPRILRKPRRVVHRWTRRQESAQTSATHPWPRRRLYRYVVATIVCFYSSLCANCPMLRACCSQFYYSTRWFQE